MRRFGRGIVLLVLAVGCGPIQSRQADGARPDEARVEAAPEATGLEVRDVRVEPLGAGRRVTLVLSREPDGVQGTPSAQPPRLVVDVPGPLAQNPLPLTRFALADSMVSQVRVGSHDGTLRAVLDLASAPGAHQVRRDGSTVVIELGEAVATAPAAPADPEPVAAAPRAAEPVESLQPEDDTLAIRDVQVEPDAGGRRLVLTLSRTPDRVRNFVLPDPPRLVIDVTGPLPPGGVMTRFPVRDELVDRVRVASNGSTLRVVADLRTDPDGHDVRHDGTRIVAHLGATLASAGDETAVLVPAVATVPVDDGLDGDGPAVAPVALETPEPPPAVAAAEPRVEAERAVVPPHAGEPAPARIELAQADVQEVPGVPEDARVAAAPPPPPAEPMRVVRSNRGGSNGPFTGQRISLDFKDADIQNVLRVLADVSQLNIIATDDVKGKVTLHLTDVPWDQALDLVLRSNRLEMSREGNVVRISTVSRLKEEREALRAAEDAERELEPVRVRYVKVNYARADEALVDKVKGVLTERGSVTFDDRTNTIIVRDIPRGVADATELIRELDVQSPQVLIEANIVEATEDFARGLGVQWGYKYQAGPQTGNPTGMNFPGTVGLGGSGLGAGVPSPSPLGGVARPGVPFLADFPVPSNFAGGFGPGSGSAIDLALGSLDGVHSLSARLTALEEQGKGRVISRPRVITMNNLAATIQSLTILRVKLPSTGTVINTGAGGAAGSSSSATEKINTGITLVVTPQISSDGYVLMNIFAKSSQPDFNRTVDGIPNEVSREANSNVLIRDGETVVLGGIFRNTSQSNETGLPYLRSVPVLGWAFKRLLRTDHHEELLVFLTPKVLASGTTQLPAAGQLWEERRQGG